MKRIVDYGDHFTHQIVKESVRSNQQYRSSSQSTSTESAYCNIFTLWNDWWDVKVGFIDSVHAVMNLRTEYVTCQ